MAGQDYGPEEDSSQTTSAPVHNTHKWLADTVLIQRTGKVSVHKVLPTAQTGLDVRSDLYKET